MNTELIIIIAIAVLLILSVWSNIIQLKKQERLEDYISELETSNNEYYTFFSQLKSYAGNALSRMRHIDRLGAFESDDETGTIFKEIKDIVNEIYEKF